MLNETEQLHVQNVYENIAKHFNNTRTYQWKWITIFLENLSSNSLVYDIGCGNGRNMLNTFNDKLSFIGIDNCNSFVQICKNKKLNTINANIIDIPLKNNSANAIICIAVFHHLSNSENRIKALKEMKRLIKDDGQILLSVWSINQPKKTRRHFNNYGNNIVLWNNYGKIYERYYYIFELEEIRAMFKTVGLNIISYNYDCGNEIYVLNKGN